MMSSTTSSSIVTVLKSAFSRFGIPEVLVTDNGPQFVSQEMKEFAKTYDFKHITSSPRYSQSNGQAERAVQTVKRLFKCSQDLYLSILNYNASPMPWCNLAPSELLMGRKLRTTVPQITKHLLPKWHFLRDLKHKYKAFRLKQKW